MGLLSYVGELPAFKNRAIAFVWQHLLLLVSIFIMTMGVALTIRSSLGSSVISSIPMAMTLAGDAGKAPGLTIGQYTNIMNVLLVLLQIGILRRRFMFTQLFQLVIGTIFGCLLDLSMSITSLIPAIMPESMYGVIGVESLPGQIIMQLAGCMVLGYGIALEIRCGSVTMPGEGLPAAISMVTGARFAKIKIVVDISLVVIAVILGYVFFGHWLTEVIGPGTLFAMIFVGLMVRFSSSRIKWFERLLVYQPGFRRYIYGLLRFIHSRNQ